MKSVEQIYLENKNLVEDDLIRLTVYSKIVSGTNYKVTFIDTKAEFPSIQEYVVYFPLPSENLNEEIIEQTEYEATNGLVTFNDPLFSKLENKLYYFLKDTNEKLIYISYIYPHSIFNHIVNRPIVFIIFRNFIKILINLVN